MPANEPLSAVIAEAVTNWTREEGVVLPAAAEQRLLATVVNAVEHSPVLAVLALPTPRLIDDFGDALAAETVTDWSGPDDVHGVSANVNTKSGNFIWCKFPEYTDGEDVDRIDEYAAMLMAASRTIRSAATTPADGAVPDAR